MKAVAVLLNHSKPIENSISRETSYTVVNTPESIAGQILPTDVYTIPYSQLTEPFEKAFKDYLQENPQDFIAQIEKLPEAPSVKEENFFNLNFEELFKIPVITGGGQAIFIFQEQNEGGVISLARVLDIYAQELKHGESQAEVTSLAQFIGVETLPATPPEPIITPPPNVTITETSITYHWSSAQFYSGEGGYSRLSSDQGFPNLLSIAPTGSSLTYFQGVLVSTATPIFTDINGDPLPIGYSLSVTSDGTFYYIKPGMPTEDVTPTTFEYQVSNTTTVYTVNFLAPIILDLTDKGIHLTSPLESKVQLGSDSLGWFQEGNGMLMLNSNGDGSLTNINQISFMQYMPGAKTDLQGLVAFDTNHDGLLNFGDKDFEQFGVLLSDGKFESLSELGIISISLTSDNNMQINNGNIVFGETTYQTANGQTHTAADTALAVIPIHDVISMTHDSAPAVAPSHPSPQPAIDLHAIMEQLHIIYHV